MKKALLNKKYFLIWAALFVIALASILIFSCTEREGALPEPLETESANGRELTGGGAAGGDYVKTTGDTSRLVQPTDIEYLGAFRLPDIVEGADPDLAWEYGGGALTYRPTGDASGPKDGFPGSLYGVGFEPLSRVSEFAIPAPVISSLKNPEELNTAETLQGFSDVGGGHFDALTELPRVGLCYLSIPETGEKIHLCWGQHFQDEEGETIIPSHAWFDLNLKSPNTMGAWWIGNQSLYSVDKYIFEIPKEWADRYAGGRYLATGRYRDGGWSGKGPSLFAYGPWLSGNPPVNGERLKEIPLILYSHTRADPFDTTDFHLNGYQHPDEWEGGAWLNTGDGRSAVIFVGTKGTGERYWYGWMHPDGPDKPCVEDEITDMVLCLNADGTPCPPEITKGCSGHNADRGWWSTDYSAQIIFYDPSVLAEVADGKLAPYQPQPYIVLDIDKYLFLPNPTADPSVTGKGAQRKYRIGGTAYDRERGHIYVIERFADGVKPVVHVFRVR
ncbi:MAG: hypothetical protein JW984_11725 [Deltaproteobacteria bacterium]|uniref:Uncharacterized protein n=1 Tax=Candidatus Zymogenus saltonus TaxID=2844893 RepID=A0A9D8PN98_9DELT|nr:hypothetical protein [Candidatus Zymogenus saltonus]